jgi:CRP-like cAMP-binding protein
MYFGGYNIEMFQLLLPYIWYKEFQPNDIIYEKGDDCKYFYYILKGSVHILDLGATEGVKIAKMHSENEIFGMKKSDSPDIQIRRSRQAIAEKETIVLKIDLKEYEDIRKKRVLSAAESKINFLTRHIPGLRSVDNKIVQEVETIFQKEKYTKGYRIIEQGKTNDNIYFIASGECRILYHYNSNPLLKKKFDSLDISMPGFMLLGKLTAGD